MFNLEFLITSLIVVLIPGTGVIYTLSIGLGLGFRASILAAMGCTLGILPACAAAIIGLSAILHTSAIAFQIVKFLGAAYLLYMAWGALRQSSFGNVNEQVERRSALKLIQDGFLLNVLNPKLSMFFLAFLPQFMAPGETVASVQFVTLSGIFILMTFVVFIIYGFLAAQARDYVIARPKVMVWLNRSFASCFAYMGLKLAITER